MDISEPPIRVRTKLGDASELNYDACAEIFLVLPLECATLAALTLPESREALRIAALPYAMETLLVEPVEHYHIMNVGEEIDGRIATCAVATDLIKALCQWIDLNFPATPSHILLDAWLLPECQPENIDVYRDKDRSLVRYGRWMALAGPRANESVLLDSIRAQPQWSKAAVNVKNLDQSIAGNNSAALAALPNLRSGMFKGYRRLDWSLPAKILITCLALLVGLQIAGNWYIGSLLNDSNEVAEQTIQDLYLATFPHSGKLTNRKIQAQRHLAVLKGQVSAQPPKYTRFVPLYGSVAAAIGARSEEQRLLSLSFDGKQAGIELKIAVSNLDQLGQLLARLKAQSLAAKMVAANEQDEALEGVILVRQEHVD